MLTFFVYLHIKFQQQQKTVMNNPCKKKYDIHYLYRAIYKAMAGYIAETLYVCAVMGDCGYSLALGHRALSFLVHQLSGSLHCHLLHLLPSEKRKEDAVKEKNSSRINTTATDQEQKMKQQLEINDVLKHTAAGLSADTKYPISREHLQVCLSYSAFCLDWLSLRLV
ncbi:unnamed protein product [Caretta caretta]